MSEINKIRALANNSMIHSNENEQYSRRNNLRFRGLEQRDGMTSSDMILDFLHSDLGLGDITANDIIAAHPLPPSKRSLNTSGESRSAVQIPTMLVKFRNRSIKDSVIRKRSILKGRKFSIDEDLTGMIVQLMNRLRNSDRVTKSWSWNCKIYATLDNNNTVIAKPFIPIDELFSLPALKIRQNKINIDCS